MSDDNDAWIKRWEEGNTGFHQEEINAHLISHWERIVPDRQSTVLVPLCGKSKDMLWLRNRGHRVVGAELSELAARAFFLENDLVAEERQSGPFVVLSAGGIEIWVGDFFELTPQRVGKLDAWYDRAAVVALEPSVRQRYLAQLKLLLGSKAVGLMLTFDYPAEERNGPPFSVSFQDVEQIFGERFRLKLIDCVDLTEGNRWELSRVWKPVIELRS